MTILPKKKPPPPDADPAAARSWAEENATVTPASWGPVPGLHHHLRDRYRGRLVLFIVGH